MVEDFSQVAVSPKQGVLQPGKPGEPGIIRKFENDSGKPENIREFKKNS